MENFDYLIIVLVAVLCLSVVFLVSAVMFNDDNAHNELPDPVSNTMISVSNDTVDVEYVSTGSDDGGVSEVKNTSKYPPEGTILEEYPDNGLGKIKYKVADGKGGYYYINRYKKDSLNANVTGEYDLE